MLGSASLVVGEEGGGSIHGLRGYEPLPDWVEAGKEPDPKLRDVDAAQGSWEEKKVMTAEEMLDNATKSMKTSMGLGHNSNGSRESTPKEKTLDDWLAEDDGENDEEDEEEESEEEESSEEVSDSEEEEESDDNDNEHENLVK
jgi:hypothetical protein